MRDHVPARWKGCVLVCGKCSKKVGGGFGPDGSERLARLLAKAAGGKGRKARFGVVETRCLKLCPKKAVVVVDGARPRDWLLVAPGTSVEAVIHRLGLHEAVPRPAVPAE